MLSLAVHIHLARFEKLSEPLFINFQDAAEEQQMLFAKITFRMRILLVVLTTQGKV